MKKIALFLTIFFFFAVLSAENPDPEAVQTAPSSESLGKTAEKTEQKPKSVFFMPSLGLDLPSLSIDLRFEVEFRVFYNKRGDALYLGFDTGVFWAPLKYFQSRLGFPLHAKFMFDFKQPSSYKYRKVLDYAGIWLAVGIAGIRLVEGVYDDHTEYDREIYFSVGGGVDMTFKNNIVLRIAILSGFDHFLLFPTGAVAVGYRF